MTQPIFDLADNSIRRLFGRYAACVLLGMMLVAGCGEAPTSDSKNVSTPKSTAAPVSVNEMADMPVDAEAAPEAPAPPAAPQPAEAMVSAGAADEETEEADTTENEAESVALAGDMKQRERRKAADSGAKQPARNQAGDQLKAENKPSAQAGNAPGMTQNDGAAKPSGGPSADEPQLSAQAIIQAEKEKLKGQLEKIEQLKKQSVDNNLNALSGIDMDTANPQAEYNFGTPWSELERAPGQTNTRGFRMGGGGMGGFGMGGGGGGREGRAAPRSEKMARGLSVPAPADSPTKTPQQRSLASFALQPGEELWVIAKVQGTSKGRERDPNVPRCGCLMATLPDATRQVPVPLKHTSVEGNISGYISTVDVTQEFHNPFDSKIEAVYVFPLPDSAAVNEFVMTVGDRKIRGIIREKEQAKKIYNAAKEQGHVASLLTQQRANIFTQKVANIEPGKKIDIRIRYFNTLQYDDGSYEFVFPMVVGPRFNPPATTDGIGAVARTAPRTTGQETEVSYLAPNERSGHDISITLNVDAGVAIESVKSVNHDIQQTPVNDATRTIKLAEHDSIPNKDFVLRYKVAGNAIKTALMTHEDAQGKFFTMMLYPSADLATVERSPMEMVFVLDCSGSMNGKPLNQAKNAVRYSLQTLTPRDSFQIIRFSSDSSQLGPEPLVATPENIQKGIEYVSRLKGGGGTQMIEGIRAALDFPHDEGRFRLVSFMTDGYIGNEQQILNATFNKLGASRIFSFGVGSSPNRMLMDRLAILGKGAVAYLSLEDDSVKIMDGFKRRISHPAMTDLAIDWGNMNVKDVYPRRLPDLFVGRPVVITGRYTGEVSDVKVNGRIDMEPTSWAVSLTGDDEQQEHAGVAAVWARLKIKDMMNGLAEAPHLSEKIESEVLETALDYNLMSSYTAFVAVDSMTKTEGEIGTTVAVPVPVPDGVKYETTVSNGGEE